jgi:hypothetical protein
MAIASKLIPVVIGHRPIEHWEVQLKVDCFTAATTFLMSSHRTRTSVVFDEVISFSRTFVPEGHPGYNGVRWERRGL